MRMSGSMDEKNAGRTGKRKKWSARRKIAVVLLALCAALAMGTFSVMGEDGVHLASLRRWLMYGESSETGDAYVYPSDPDGRFAALGDGLLAVTPHAIRFYSGGDTVLYDISVELADPQISVGRDHACVCDVGGSVLYILDKNGLTETRETSRELCYYSARLNGSDYLTVTEQKSGYKASVSVYDSAGTPVYYFDSYETYICDAIVTEDGKYLVAVGMEPEDGVFASTLTVYDLGGGEARSVCALRDALVMETVSRGDRLISLCDKRLAITDLDGNTVLDYPFGSLYLHDYALDGDGSCALLLGRYRAGNLHTLTTFDLNGNVLASMDVSGEVLDMDARGDLLAVLYGDSLVVYRSDLTEYARWDGSGYAGQLQFAPDGTLLLISGTLAQRYRP